jgi:hypothetical protein
MKKISPFNPLKMSDQEKIKVLENYEAQCNGTDEYHQYNTFIAAALLTDGVLLMCETFGCFWLIDLILSYQTKAFKLKNPPIEHPIQYWFIEVDKAKSSCVVYMEYHEGVREIEQHIEYTDFPLEKKAIKFDAYNRVICLIAED